MFTPGATSTLTPQASSLTPSSSLNTPKKNILPYVVTTLNVLMSFAALGAVYYAFNLRDDYQAKIDEKKKELAQVTYTQEVPLQTMSNFSGKVKGVAGIFENAPSAYSTFPILETAIEKGVSFGQMSATRVEGTKSYKVRVTGTAKSLDALELQRDAFLAPAFKNYVSAFHLDSFSYDPETGIVTFSLSFMTTVGRFATSNLLVDIGKSDEVANTAPIKKPVADTAPAPLDASTTNATSSVPKKP